MPCFWCPTVKLRTWPIESWFKVFGLSFHIYMEIRGGLNFSNGFHFEYENAHHICMIIGFIVGALVEILVYHGLPLPKNVEIMFNLLAFLIQVIIMAGHLDGDSGLEYIVHKLWTILIVLTFVAACCEAYDPTNLWSAYMRICFFLAQGTWLMQIAFVVWPHTTNPYFIFKPDHGGHTWLTIWLMFHLIIAALTLMTQYVIVFYAIELFDRCYTKYELDVKSTEYVDEPIKFDYRHQDGREYKALLIHDQDENESIESV